jgi:hypothetical protein
MNEDTRKAEDLGADRTDPGGAGNGEDGQLDLQSAAAIMAEAREKAQHELTVRHPAVFMVWGLVYLIGYGVIWLTVRGQHPYRAPSGAAISGVFVLAAIGLAITASLVSRATSGVAGASDRQRRSYYLAVAVGYLGFILLDIALSHAGASQSVIGVFGASGPIYLIGIAFAVSSTTQTSWSVFGLGVWLIASAALSGFAGPRAVWGVLALAVGAGFLGAAAVQLARSRA